MSFLASCRALTPNFIGCGAISLCVVTGPNATKMLQEPTAEGYLHDGPPAFIVRKGVKHILNGSGDGSAVTWAWKGNSLDAAIVKGKMKFHIGSDEEKNIASCGGSQHVILNGHADSTSFNCPLQRQSAFLNTSM